MTRVTPFYLTPSTPSCKDRAFEEDCTLPNDSCEAVLDVGQLPEQQPLATFLKKTTEDRLKGKQGFRGAPII